MAFEMPVIEMTVRFKQTRFQFLFDQSNVNGPDVPRSWCSDAERPLCETSTSLEHRKTRWAEIGARVDVRK